jgi:hypothetical protein
MYAIDTLMSPNSQICTNKYIHMCSNMYKYVHTYVHVYMHTCVHATQVYTICTHARANSNVPSHYHRYTCMHRRVHIPINICIHAVLSLHVLILTGEVYNACIDRCIYT